MRRITPKQDYENFPCSICAVACATEAIPKDIDEYLEQLNIDGYATLQTANKFIRKHLNIKKRSDFKRGLRPKLKNLHYAGKAIVCVYGHFIYLDHEDYWSFYDNEDDDVVAVWMIK